MVPEHRTEWGPFCNSKNYFIIIVIIITIIIIFKGPILKGLDASIARPGAGNPNVITVFLFISSPSPKGLGASVTRQCGSQCQQCWEPNCNCFFLLLPTLKCFCILNWSGFCVAIYKVGTDSCMYLKHKKWHTCTTCGAVNDVNIFLLITPKQYSIYIFKSLISPHSLKWNH